MPRFSFRSLRIGWLIFGLLLVSIGCDQTTDPVVAKIGRQKITLNEFRTAYLELLKKPEVLDSPQLRENYLNELINQQLIATRAQKLGLHRDEKYRFKSDAYRDKCLRDVHYQEVIQPQIRISDKELQEAYLFTTQQKRLKHLFFESKEAAQECFKKLQNGESWNVLAQTVFKDSLLAVSGGDLGWVYWDQLEYDMGEVAFRQKVNTVSEPIKSSFGYHLLKVVDYRINPLVSQSEYDLHRRKVKYMLEKKIGDKLAAEYISKMMAERKIEARTEMMRMTAQKFTTLFRRDPGLYDQMLEAQLTPAEVHALEENFWNYRNETLVIIDGKPLTIGEFIYNLNYIPYAAIRQGFKTALDYVIRDRVLVNEAERMRLEKKYPVVRHKTKTYENFLLQTELRRSLIQSIAISDEMIARRFEHDQKSLFKNMAIEDVSETIREILLQEEKQRVINDMVNSLRQKQSVKINCQSIHAYYDNLNLGNHSE